MPRPRKGEGLSELDKAAIRACRAQRIPVRYLADLFGITERHLFRVLADGQCVGEADLTFQHQNSSAETSH